MNDSTARWAAPSEPAPPDKSAGSARLLTPRPGQTLHGIDDSEELAHSLQHWPSAFSGEPRFVLGERLGQGAQGIVFALRDRDLQRTVALKTLHGRDLEHEDAARFLAEVQITAQLEHPGIVPVHDVGVLPDGTVYYTMKRIDGLVLPEWLKGRAGVAAHRYEVLQLFLKVCDTLAFAHSRGVIHRDLKPRNIMVGAYGEVLVMDWGLAKVRARSERLRCPGSELARSPLADLETQDGTAIGTPAYMSPEQALGQNERVDHRSDIYSLGVILYEMLAGTSPYQRGDLRRTLDQVVQGRWTPLERQPSCRDVPRRLCAIVHKAMAYRQEARYQQVSDLAADIRSFLAGEAVSAYSEGALERALRWLQQHRRGAWSVFGSALAIAIAAGSAWLWQARREDRAVAELRELVATAVALGDWTGARQASERILAYRPDDEQARQDAARFDERARLAAEMAAREAERRQRRERDRTQAALMWRHAERLAERDDIAGLDEAVQLARQALALDPENAAIAAALDRWRDRLSLRRSEAELAARRAAELQQRQANADALLATAEERERQGDLDGAVGALQSAYELAPQPELLERLVAVSQRREQRRRAYEEELRAAEQAAARAARQQEAERHCAAARAALRGEDPERAAAALERAAALLPDHPEIATLRRELGELQLQLRQRQIKELLTQASAVTTALGNDNQQLAAVSAELQRLRREPADPGDAARRTALVEAEERLLAVRQQRAERIAEALRILNHALVLDPAHQAVRATLAGFWVQRMLEAEASSDPAEAAAAEAQARAYDDGSLRAFLDGKAWIENRGRVALTITAIRRRADRTEGPVGEELRVEPASRLELSRGRYWVRADHGGQMAVVLERGQSRSIEIPAPPRRIPDGCVFVPGGPVYDEQGAVIASVGHLVAQVREVTCGEWLEFLNDRSVREEIDRAAEAGRGLIYAPRRDPYATRAMWRRSGGIARSGSFQLIDDSDGSPIDPARPVSYISHDDAVAYASWRARREGRPWRLPTIDEWRRLVQAGDPRSYPWGAVGDLGLCASAITLARDRRLAEAAGGSVASDRSLHGILDLAGSRAEFAAGSSPLGADLRPLLGGSLYDAQPERFSAWGRRDIDRRLVHAGWGLRLVYTPENEP